MKIFSVIPNWNEAELLKECLDSLKKQTLDHKIIVVDNGSSDDSLQVLGDYPKVHVIKNTVNMGFTGGVNPGIEYALKNGADAIALINNDAVADINWLEQLSKVMGSSPEYGMVTSKIMLSDKKHLDSTGDFYSVYGIPFPRGRNQIDSKQFDDIKTVFGASGGGTMYRAETIKDIGLFDQRFFAYYEDVDMSYRAQLAGWSVAYAPSAIVYHRLSVTSSKMGDFSRYHSIKNFLLVYTKDMPGLLYWKYFPRFTYQYVRTFVRSIIDLQLHIFLKANFKFLMLLPSVLRDRHHIQKSRKVSIKYIDSTLYKARPPKIPSIDQQ